MKKYLRKKSIILLTIIFFIIILILLLIFNKNNIIFSKKQQLSEKIKAEIEKKTETTYKINSANENDLDITITIKNESGIVKVITPENQIITPAKAKKQISIDYKIEDEKQYIFKVQLQDSEELNEYILKPEYGEKPEIKQNVSNQYPKLTNYGVKLGKKVTIDYGENTENYYSIDNGENWVKYPEEGLEINKKCTVLAKSIVDGEITKVAKENVTMQLVDDAIGLEAYDDNSDTYTVATKKFMELDDNLAGEKVKLDINCPQWNHIYVVFFKEDKKTRTGGSAYWHTSYNRGYAVLEIPEDAKYLGIIDVQENYANTCYLYNVEIDTEPIGNTMDLYPCLDLDGIKNKDKFKIKYFKTAIKKLYSYDNKNWLDYPEDGIDLKFGNTVYAKSIDKYGNSSIVMTYKNELTDILEIEAYDGNEQTKTLAYDKILYVNSNVWNKKLNVKIEANLYSRVNIRFLNENNEILKEYSNANGVFDEEYIIPENTKKITWKYTDGNGALSYIYRIQLNKN